MQTEFVRSLNCNYERILLEKKPEEKKYQYCMLSRGGIKGLLSCNLRYINGLAYLYYDISSKQSVGQLFENKTMNRGWIKDFFWSLEQIRLELSRFLLDEQNVLWYPQQIFQDLENNIFSFLYVPYYEGSNGFQQLLEFMVEHIDYEDESLVECIYKVYEQYDKAGETYLQKQVFEDIKLLDSVKAVADVEEEPGSIYREPPVEERVSRTARADEQSKIHLEQNEVKSNEAELLDKREKKGLFSLFEGHRKRDRDSREAYQDSMQLAMKGYAVAEETIYEEDWGRTTYVEESLLQAEPIHRLCTREGRLMAELNTGVLTIGKKRDEVDCVLEDLSVSRIHARILKEQEAVYLEDLNSTNGTFKNGLRLQPYEKKRLEEGDEIRLGKVTLIYY